MSPTAQAPGRLPDRLLILSVFVTIDRKKIGIIK